MSITLADIAAKLNSSVNGNPKQEIDTLSIDSRTIFPAANVLFVAIKGERNDGHEYIPQLIKKGIINFITEVPVSQEGINSILVDDSIQALQQVAQLNRSHYNGNVIAITGSNGKTTVKEWLWSCLSCQQNVFRSPKSYNSQVGVPLSVWEINNQHQTAIIEAGISHPNEMKYLQQIINPTIGIFTTLGDAHQQNFNSLRQKLDEKLRLFKDVHTLFYNGDEELVQQAIEKTYPDKKHIFYARKNENAFLNIKAEKSSPGGYQVELSKYSTSHTLYLPFQDKASVENLLMVCQVLLYFGFSFEAIQEQFNKLEPVAMRLQQVSGYNNCTIINDSYNSDLTSVKIAIDFLMQQKQHQKTVFILSDIMQSGISKQELYRQVADLVIQNKISQFIGIGPDISNHQGLFPSNSRVFKNTESFLQQLNDDPIKDATLLIKGARVFQFENIVQALEMKQHRTTLEINYNAIIHNLNYFKSLLKPGTKMLVMVKALAYGSGGIEIARLLQHQRVDYLAVAFADEGVELRKSGITTSILVMNPSGLDFQTIVDHHLEPEIYSFRILQEWLRFLNKESIQDYPVHLKIDTGMHRLGFAPDETDDLIEILQSTREINVKSIFTHLAATDMPEHDDFTAQQVTLFQHVSDRLTSILKEKPMLHVLNSAGIERFKNYQFDMVRLGIGLYGVSVKDENLIQDISRLKTHISQIKTVKSSETIGYSRNGKIEQDSTIAILPIGYADGIHRKLGNGTGQFWLNGHLVKTIGNICMDMCMIDITGIEAQDGDEVVIFGPENPISRLADQMGTIPYEILTSISSRVKKVYFHE